MDPLHVIALIIILTVLFALGGKVVIYYKNREIALIKEKYEQEISLIKQDHENMRVTISDEMFKHNKRTEEHYQRKLAEKDRQIEDLLNEINELKAWKDELAIKMAEFKGASHGTHQMLLYKLIEHNQKLNRALNEKWEKIEENLSRELQITLEKLKEIFSDAEQLHRDSIEIISEYEARLPEDFKKKVQEELRKLPDAVKFDS